MRILPHIMTTLPVVLATIDDLMMGLLDSVQTQATEIQKKRDDVDQARILRELQDAEFQATLQADRKKVRVTMVALSMM